MITGRQENCRPIIYCITNDGWYIKNPKVKGNTIIKNIDFLLFDNSTYFYHKYEQDYKSLVYKSLDNKI